MYSVDDNNYLRLGILEGLFKICKEKIIILIDVDKVRKLLKYDWLERLVYIIFVVYRVFIKEEWMDNGGEIILIIKEDIYFVVIRFKVFVFSIGFVWVSEVVMF